MELSEKDLIRFWKKVNKNGPVMQDELGPCWIWAGSRYGNRYGAFKIGRKEQLAHRVMYKIIHKIDFLSKKQLVCHKCDNPICVRPEHFFLGTHKENTEDAKRKGRIAYGDRSGRRKHPGSYPKGENDPRAKLSTSDVIAIRDMRNHGHTLSSIAGKFNIAFQTVSKIVNNQRRVTG